MPRYQRNKYGAFSVSHGQSNSPTYVSWCAMKSRCLRPCMRSYPRYGGRGITICDRWMVFANFLADMGERPKGMTLDRIDNDGNYEPGNCRWADNKTQHKNKTNNRKDLAGQTFGRLTAIAYSHTHNRHAWWIFSCSCGKTKVIDGYSVVSGNTRSCGCLHVERLKNSPPRRRAQLA